MSGENLGAVLRTIRNAQGLTLGDLHSKTGIPVSTLSKMETGRSSLSYDKLVKLAEGLDVDISSLVAGAGPMLPFQTGMHMGRRSITRRAAGMKVDTQPYQYTYPASDLLHKAFMPMIVQVKCKNIDQFGELIRHHGEEFAIVMSGSIIFHTDVYAPEILHVGDSVYFDSSIGHAYLAGEDGPCTLLSVCSAKLEELKATRPASLQEFSGNNLS